MALTVEDGTGLPDAEAYISVTDADAYFTARGNTAWAALTAEAKEQALRRACDYMGAVYGLRWKSERTTTAQALDWPRVDYNGVPAAVARANAELAVRASAGDLLADQGAQVKSEQVGPIAVTYADGARQGKRYALVDGMLAAYLRDAGAGLVAVVRA